MTDDMTTKIMDRLIRVTPLYPASGPSIMEAYDPIIRPLVEGTGEVADFLELRVMDIIPEIDRPALQARINLLKNALE